MTVIIAVLAAATIPLAHNAFQRQKEIELRRALRMLRTAIDDYKKFVEENKIEVDEDTYGYPEKLEDLVKGIEYKDKKNKTRMVKFLRRIPLDPVSASGDWGLRSYQDKLGSRSGAAKTSGTYTAIQTKKPWTARFTAIGERAAALKIQIQTQGEIDPLGQGNVGIAVGRIGAIEQVGDLGEQEDTIGKIQPALRSKTW